MSKINFTINRFNVGKVTSKSVQTHFRFLDNGRIKSVYLPFSQVGNYDKGGNLSENDINNLIESRNTIEIEIPKWLLVNNGLYNKSSGALLAKPVQLDTNGEVIISDQDFYSVAKSDKKVTEINGKLDGRAFKLVTKIKTDEDYTMLNDEGHHVFCFVRRDDSELVMLELAPLYIANKRTLVVERDSDGDFISEVQYGIFCDKSLKGILKNSRLLVKRDRTLVFNGTQTTYDAFMAMVDSRVEDAKGGKKATSTKNNPKKKTVKDDTPKGKTTEELLKEALETIEKLKAEKPKTKEMLIGEATKIVEDHKRSQAELSQNDISFTPTEYELDCIKEASSVSFCVFAKVGTTSKLYKVRSSTRLDKNVLCELLIKESGNFNYNTLLVDLQLKVKEILDGSNYDISVVQFSKNDKESMVQYFKDNVDSSFNNALPLLIEISKATDNNTSDSEIFTAFKVSLLIEKQSWASKVAGKKISIAFLNYIAENGLVSNKMYSTLYNIYNTI